MATNGWIGEQTVHSWGRYNSRLTTNVYINGIRRYSDHIDVSGVIYLFCKSSGARTVWYDWAITAWCGGGSLGQIKPRTYNNNILGKSWSKNFSIRINCSNSATSATFRVGFSDSNMGGKDKYWTLYFDRYATSPSGITSAAAYTQYSTISTSCSGINWGQGYSNRKLTCVASYTYNGKTENFTLGTWTDGATSKSVTKTDFNFPADLNVTVKWTASTNIGSTSSTAQIRVKQTFPAPNLNNTTFTAESIAPYCIRVNVSGVDFGDNYSARKLELYGTYELDGIIYDNKLGEISNQTSWTLEYDASQEVEPWTKIPDDSSILLRLVADNGNRTSDKTIIINCQSSYEAYVIEHISEEEKEKSETYTGKNIQIQNAPKDAPLADFKLDGETNQQTYSGKNLFKLPATATANNVTFTNNGDGTFNISTSGTASAHTEFAVVVPLAQSGITGGQSYTVSSNATISSSAINLWVHSCSSIGAWSKTLMSFTSAGTRTAEAPSTDYIKFVIGVESGKTVNFSNVKLQLEKGSSATSFEPYVGGTASPNPDYPQAVQTVTGENVVKICGKNLCDGVNQNYWLNAGAYSAGQTTGNSGIGISVSANTDYTISTKVSQARYRAAFVDSLPTRNTVFGEYKGKAKFGTSDSITINSGSHNYLIVNATSLSDIQIEKSSQATDFEPYQGQSYEVNLGKNLFNQNDVVNGIPSARDGSITSTSGAGRTSDYIPVMPNTVYSHTGHPAGWATVAWYKADKSFIVRVNDITTTTSPSEAAYARVSCAQSNLGTCQFEAGGPTSYAAYFTPIELCKIGDYQDSIYKRGGKWYVHKEIGDYVATGDEDISIISRPTSKMIYIPNDEALQGSSNTLLSTHFIYEWANNIGACYVSGSNHVIACGVGGVTTVESARTWLASNEPKFVYMLATPTDTEITNEALVAQLEALLNTARTYAGINNIFTITPNEQGTLEIQYYTKWQNTSPAILSANGRNGTGNFKQVRRIGTK